MTSTAVVLLNLGGPDSPESVRSFLVNLFSDPAILKIPSLPRWFLSRLIASRRSPIARASYAKIGGHSPLLKNTQEQARALELKLSSESVRVLVAMRYWHPKATETALRVAEFNPDQIVLLPLYPQFSSSTTASSFKDWDKSAQHVGLDVPVSRICCFSEESGFVEAMVKGTRRAIAKCKSIGAPRVLFSAHGLPKKFVVAGDPYQDQVERTAAAIATKLAIAGLDHIVCYQSRVGRLEWLRPYTDDEIRRAGRDRVPVVVVPIAFVSEHSETLVELDIDYAKLAEMSGVPMYYRVPTAGTDVGFITSLARLVGLALAQTNSALSGQGGRVCPAMFGDCPMNTEGASS